MLRTLFVLGLAVVGLRYSLRGSFYILLLYLWIAYFRPEEWVWGDFVRNLNLSLLTGTALVGSTLLSREQVRFDLRRAVFVLFAAQTLVSLLVAEHPEYSSPLWVDFAKAAVITYLISLLASDPGRIRLVFAVIGLSLGFEAAKQGWVQLVINPGGQNQNEIAMLGDNNGVAVGILMLIPILVALSRTTNRVWEQRIYQLVAGGSAYRALITYSRGGFLSCGALLLLLVIRSKRRMRTALAIAILAALILPALPDSFWDRMGTITTEEDQMDTSSRSRVHFWRVAILMANEKPLTGVGYNGYNLSYNDYDFSYGVYGSARSVHSSWFGVLAELGYTGLVLFVANIVLALAACRRARRLAARDPAFEEVGHYAVAIEASLIVFIIGGSFVPSQYVEILWHFFGLSAAIYTLAQRREIELEEEALRARVAPAPYRPSFAQVLQ
jgi:probable O-glycosylation ligase (exosortase A-associated)